MRRRASWVRVVVFAGLAYVVVGCGGGDGSSDVEAGQAPGVELRGVAADRLTLEAPQISPEFAAANGQLLLVGGIESTEDPAFLRLADDAVIVDTGTGEAEVIDAPRADVPVHVAAAVGGTDGFVVTGQRCREGDQLPADDWFCSPGSGTAFVLERGARAWTEIPFSDELSPARTEEPWTFQSRLGATPDGQVFALVFSGPSDAAAAKSTRLLVLEDGSWTGRTVLPIEQAPRVCATQDAFYALTSTPSTSPIGDGQPPPADMTLYEIPNRGGEPETVPLPEIDASYGGVAVALACDRSGPYLTSSTAAPDAPMVLFGRREGQWRAIGGDWSPGIVDRMASAPDGIAVVSMALSADRFDTHTVSANADNVVTAPARYGERRFVADATSGDFVTVGPISTLRLAPEPSTSQGPITVDRVGP